MEKNHNLKSIFYKYYFIITLILICFIGFLDWVTGWELQFFIFYFLPIGIIVWFGNLTLGIIASSLSIFTWGLIDILAGHLYSSIYIFVWNGSIRLIAFIIFALFLFKIKADQEARRDLLNFIVHDLRIPLATISSGLGNLEDLTALDGHQKEIVNICKIASQRGLTLINSILDLARIEAQKMQLDIKNVDIDKIIISSQEVVSIYAMNQGATFEKKLGILPENFHTDHLLLQRILINLFSNAIKASKAGGVISVYAAEVDKKLMLSVADKGIGFPAHFSSNIFSKFVQFHSNEKGSIGGSGLGLAFCKQAVELLGGNISIESRENEGTKVTFILPNKRDQAGL